VHFPFHEVLEKRAGVCQDFTHLLIAIFRSWGVPARYVMGYQYLPAPDSEELKPATHAWVEAYLPGRGWQGFDATQQLLANETYIPVAVGRDSRDAAPQRGCYKGGIVSSEPRVELRVVGQQ
jgi:transglutaminase-like putative cysteine protease